MPTNLQCYLGIFYGKLQSDILTFLWFPATSLFRDKIFNTHNQKNIKSLCWSLQSEKLPTRI